MFSTSSILSGGGDNSTSQLPKSLTFHCSHSSNLHGRLPVLHQFVRFHSRRRPATAARNEPSASIGARRTRSPPQIENKFLGFEKFPTGFRIFRQNERPTFAASASGSPKRNSSNIQILSPKSRHDITESDRKFVLIEPESIQTWLHWQR
jgi:hypothetical protein